MAVKLHRCSATFAKAQGHPCWKVQSALDEAGVEYELVTHVPFLRSRRKDVIAGTGQSKLPAVQREDGSWYHKDSGEMAAEIRGGLFSGDGGARADPDRRRRADGARAVAASEGRAREIRGPFPWCYVDAMPSIPGGRPPTTPSFVSAPSFSTLNSSTVPPPVSA